MASDEEQHSEEIDRPPTRAKLRKHALLSAACVVIGFVTVVIVGYVEDDPIIPPFVLIAFGIGWFIVTLIRMRTLRKSPRPGAV